MLLKSVIKFLVIMFLKKRLQHFKGNFFNLFNLIQKTTHRSNTQSASHLVEPDNEIPPYRPNNNQEFKQLKKNIAVLIESRAGIFKRSIEHEIKRVVGSLLGFMFMLASVIFAGLIGIMWLFALAWTSPNRELILGIIMLVPIVASVVIFITIKKTWKQEPLFAQGMHQIENDWLVFRGGLDGTADTSDAANN